MKIVFMGTPEFAVYSLDVLNQRGDEVALVVSQEDKPKGRGKKMQPTPVKQKAIEYGYPIYQPKRIREIESVEILKKINPDLIVVTAFGQILTKEILDIPRLGCINVHASLLPKYRGAAPINFSIIEGEEYTGITTMYMAEGLDTGDMILSDKIKIEDTDTASELHDKLALLSQKTLRETLALIEKGVAPRTKQDDSISTYAPMMKKELGHIDFSKEAKAVINLIRGVNPWPGAYVKLGDEIVKISGAKLGEKTQSTEYGKIFEVNSDHITIISKENNIEIYEVQFPNKKKMPVKEYIKGNNIETGSFFS